ncbi:MAG: hypothetical protein AAGU11_02090 [Syntrophobacteraceae bacterium]
MSTVYSEFVNFDPDVRRLLPSRETTVAGQDEYSKLVNRTAVPLPEASGLMLNYLQSFPTVSDEK